MIKDPKKKRKVTMIIHLCVIFAFIIAMFIPQLNELAYEQGYEFGTETCQSKLEDFYNQTKTYDITGDFRVERLPEGLSET